MAFTGIFFDDLDQYDDIEGNISLDNHGHITSKS